MYFGVFGFVQCLSHRKVFRLNFSYIERCYINMLLQCRARYNPTVSTVCARSHEQTHTDSGNSKHIFCVKAFQHIRLIRAVAGLDRASGFNAFLPAFFFLSFFLSGCFAGHCKHGVFATRPEKNREYFAKLHLVLFWCLNMNEVINYHFPEWANILRR